MPAGVCNSASSFSVLRTDMGVAALGASVRGGTISACAAAGLSRAALIQWYPWHMLGQACSAGA